MRGIDCYHLKCGIVSLAIAWASSDQGHHFSDTSTFVMDTFTRPVPRSKNLVGHTALITGASGGCGHAIAHYLGMVQSSPTNVG